MSLILDALRKSEQERRQADPPIMAAVASEALTVPARRFRVLPVTVTLAVLGVALGASWLFLGPREVATIRPVAQAKPVDAPVDQSAPSPSEDEAPNKVRPAPELTTNPFVPASPKTVVARDLAKEARVEPPSAPAPRVAPKQERVALAAPRPAVTRRANEEVKFLRAMPREFQSALPDLVVNIHIYAPREAERILYINNRQYHAGDKVGDDLVVEEIVEDGAILRHRGQAFKLARPS